MSEITVELLASDKAKKVNLPATVFGCDVNIPLIHQVVVAQLAAARQGTHATKTRGDVSGGGIKPWRQKGTGRARQGSRRAPQWAGGGVVHGPHPRSYAQRTPKKMIVAALKSVLSERVADGKLFVIQSLSFDAPSTRKAMKALSVIGDFTSALVVLHRDEDIAWLSLRNVPTVHAIAVDQINVYDVVSNQVTVFTKDALDEFIARFEIDELAEVEVKQPKTVHAATSLEVQTPDEPETGAKAGTAAETDTGAETETESETESETDEGTEVKDYGEGSYRGSNPPEGFDIKGNEDSMLFHTPSSPWYKRTIAEVWFNSAEAAQNAGFTDVMEGKK